MISEYAESLAGRLIFDPSLSDRVRREVEDHLREAVVADLSCDAMEAQRRAIAKFGDPGAIAAQIAAVALAEHLRRIGVTVMVVIAGIFLTMKVRLAWYDLTRRALCEDTRALGEVVGLVDRSSFWLAVIGAMAAWAYLSSRRAPTSFHRACRAHFHRFLLLCVIAASGVFTSVISDGVLTALRLLPLEWSVDFLIPIGLMAVETACAVALVFRIARAAHRIAVASCAFDDDGDDPAR